MAHSLRQASPSCSPAPATKPRSTSRSIPTCSGMPAGTRWLIRASIPKRCRPILAIAPSIRRRAMPRWPRGSSKTFGASFALTALVRGGRGYFFTSCKPAGLLDPLWKWLFIGAPHGHQDTCFAAHAKRAERVDRRASFQSVSKGRLTDAAAVRLVWTRRTRSARSFPPCWRKASPR